MERQGNSNQEGSTNDLMTYFEWITGRISQGGQFIWNTTLQACHLMLEVSRQTSMSMVNIIFDGGENRFHILKETLKESGKKILNIGQAVRQVFMDYWANPEALDLNVDLQDVLDPNVDLQETEPEEEHSNQSSSGQRTPNEESDISLDTKISF